MQNNVYIEIPRDLNSYEFYNNVIFQKNKAKISNEQNIILDFSRTLRVEPVVIPNLLCMGYELRKQYNRAAYVYIPDVSYSGELKNYLNEIDFIKYAQRFGLYDFVSSPYGGLEGKHIDPICGTIYFDVDDTVDIINQKVENCIIPFADEYLYKFQSVRKCNQGIYYVNEIAEFLEEMILNCKQHAKSFSFTTLHAKYSMKKIYISVSDFGCGFGNTIRSENSYMNEIEAILLGVYKRKDSKVYGLYNIIRRVLNFGGKVRIHSNNAQIIFTQRVLKEFIDNKLFEANGFVKYNLKSNIPFDGVHIEVELPLERRESCV